MVLREERERRNSSVVRRRRSFGAALGLFDGKMTDSECFVWLAAMGTQRWVRGGQNSRSARARSTHKVMQSVSPSKHQSYKGTKGFMR